MTKTEDRRKWNDNNGENNKNINENDWITNVWIIVIIFSIWIMKMKKW